MSLWLKTERLLLRRFEESDMDALQELLGDREVNRFLPWFPVESREETVRFYRERLSPGENGPPGYYAVCLRETGVLVGYVKVERRGSHDLGYALGRSFWRQGLMTEAGLAVLEQLKQEEVPFVTATHDRENPRSGAVMERLGMRYQYSYQERWQPKDRNVVFRLYQKNLDGREDRIYWDYWNRYPVHFVEKDVSPGSEAARQGCGEKG